MPVYPGAFQKHDYPFAAHRRSYARRTGAERGFATAKDPATNDITRGWCRLMGLAPLMLFTTTLLIVRNQRILTAWSTRQQENARRAAPGPAAQDPAPPPQDPHHTRRRAALARQLPPRTRMTATQERTTGSGSTPGNPRTNKKLLEEHKSRTTRRQPQPRQQNVRGKRENRPH